MSCLLVVCNDICAYVAGKAFGKNKLIEVSPKKTWEGFIGGLIGTLLFAFFAANHLATPALICRQYEFTVIPFQDLTCPTPDFLIPFTVSLPSVFKHVGLGAIQITELQIHTVVLGLWASAIAPFGGFFASGIKRAMKIKVVSSIPMQFPIISSRISQI